MFHNRNYSTKVLRNQQCAEKLRSLIKSVAAGDGHPSSNQKEVTA